jgi:hypothetical protein
MLRRFGGAMRVLPIKVMGDLSYGTKILHNETLMTFWKAL